MPIRGELTGLYPDHFLDVASLGWGRTLTNGLGVLVAFVLVSLLLLLAQRWQTLRTPGAHAAEHRQAPDGAARRR